MLQGQWLFLQRCFYKIRFLQSVTLDKVIVGEEDRHFVERLAGGVNKWKLVDLFIINLSFSEVEGVGVGAVNRLGWKLSMFSEYVDWPDFECIATFYVYIKTSYIIRMFNQTFDLQIFKFLATVYSNFKYLWK